MLLGLVSNVWNVQLAAGTPLPELVARAAASGYRVFELRQRSLGACEAGDEKLPDADALARLAADQPALHFIPAGEVPFLDAATTASHAYFAAGLRAAVAVANGRQPHLRLVDLRTTNDALAAASIDRVAAAVVGLTGALATVDGVLSLEPSRQPWSLFSAVVAAARARLGADAHRLRVCFDPCNLVGNGDPTDPAGALETLQAEHVGMLHYKQRRGGALAADVGPGEVDWLGLVPRIVARQLFAPALFEMASDQRLWQHLAGSSNFLGDLWSATGTSEPWGR